MRKSLITYILLILNCITATAQTNKNNEPKGKAILQVFTNFSNGFGHKNNERGFELERSYMGYEHRLSSELTAKAIIDFGKPLATEDYHRIAYLKNAMIEWKKDRFTLSGGLISTTLFHLQEKFWGHRYVMKSFQDEYKFGSSADLGLSASYRFNNVMTADAMIVNGEGYRKIQKGSGLNYGLGLTISPITGLTMRVYGGINESEQKGKSDVINVATFVGYKSKWFSLATEYNQLINKGYSMNGYSIYGTANIRKDIKIIARFDNLFSESNWNISKDKATALLGAEFIIGRYVKIAPNIRLEVTKEAERKNNLYGFVNCYFGF